VTELARTVSATTAALGGGRDSLVLALVRYVEALHQRYPDGPDQMRKESLDARANMPRMCKNTGGRAA
jgi:homoserine kinase